MATAVANPDSVRKGQTGTVFRCTIKDDADDTAVDVSNASTKEIKAKKPDGTIITKSASHTNSGTDGKIEFEDTAGDFTDTAGDWRYWGYVELPGGFTGDSTTLYYEVVEVGSG